MSGTRCPLGVHLGLLTIGEAAHSGTSRPRCCLGAKVKLLDKRRPKGRARQGEPGGAAFSHRTRLLVPRTATPKSFLFFADVSLRKNSNMGRLSGECGLGGHLGGHGAGRGRGGGLGGPGGPGKPCSCIRGPERLARVWFSVWSIHMGRDSFRKPLSDFLWRLDPWGK